jgi:hypothetical protein
MGLLWARQYARYFHILYSIKSSQEVIFCPISIPSILSSCALFTDEEAEALQGLLETDYECKSHPSLCSFVRRATSQKLMSSNQSLPGSAHNADIVWYKSEKQTSGENVLLS